VITESARIIFEGDAWVVLEISKSCLVVLTRAELVAGLKRGKAWRRQTALRARLEARTGDRD
jgi:hypothetical protein